MENVSRRLCKLLASTAIIYVLSLSHAAAAALNEGFESPDNTVGQLQSEGWTFINNSNPQGSPTTGWGINNDSASTGGVLFPHSGSNWIGADFSSGANNVVSDWMILPTMTFQQASSLTFSTVSAASDVFPDRLRVLLSINGNSSNVGPAGSTTNFGDFTNSLIDINPTYATGSAYPNIGSGQTYAPFGSLGLGQFAGDTGRIAFQYFLTNTEMQGSHIAVDDISVNNIVTAPVPAPVIGRGLLVLLTVGGALFGSELLERSKKRRSL